MRIKEETEKASVALFNGTPDARQMPEAPDDMEKELAADGEQAKFKPTRKAAFHHAKSPQKVAQNHLKAKTRQ